MTTKQPRTRFHPDALRKILDLERDTGCRNKAVVGGLDAFLERQAQHLASLAGDGDPGGLLSVTYDDLAPDERAAWIERWLSRLDPGVEPASTPVIKGGPRFGLCQQPGRMRLLTCRGYIKNREEGHRVSQTPPRRHPRITSRQVAGRRQEDH